MRTRHPSQKPEIELAFVAAKEALVQAEINLAHSTEEVREKISPVRAYVAILPQIMAAIGAKGEWPSKNHKRSYRALRMFDEHMREKQRVLPLRLPPGATLRERMGKLDRTENDVVRLNKLTAAYESAIPFFHEKSERVSATIAAYSQALPITLPEYLEHRAEFEEAFRAAPSNDKKRKLVLDTFPKVMERLDRA